MSSNTRSRCFAACLASLVTLGCQPPLTPTHQHQSEPHQADARFRVLQAPSNDDFDSATIVGTIPFGDNINTAEATTAADDPDCAGQGPTVWYRFTPTEDMEMLVIANTFGSEYDTTLSLYTGERGNLTQLDCNDDFNSLQSRIRFFAEAGNAYHMMVGAFGSGAGGNLTFTVQPAPPPLTIDGITVDTASVVPSTGVVTLAGTVTTSAAANVNLNATLEQRNGQLLFSSDGFVATSSEAAVATPWQMTIEPRNGLFSGGTATLRLGVNAFHSEDSVQEARVLSIRLQGISPPRIERLRVSLSDLTPGLHTAFFSLPPDTFFIPDLSALTPDGTYIAPDIDVPNASCTVPFQEVVDEDGEWYAVRYTGVLQVESRGTTRFTLASDDGSKLYLGDQLLIDNDGLHGFQARSAQVDLNRGFYAIQVDFLQGPCGDRGLQLSWTPSGGTSQIIPPEVLFHMAP